VRVTLDANILVYALHANDPRHFPATEIVARALVNDCVQTLQSFGECFNALVRKRYLDPLTARERVAAIQAKAVVVTAQMPDLHEAMALLGCHKLQFWDAMLWATARRAGCRLILSEDMQDGRDLEGVVFLNPLNSANRQLIDLALPVPGGLSP
jgi:predicted nucleic acid-binding protein